MTQGETQKKSPDHVWITWDDAYPWETPEMGGEEYVRAASLIDTRAPVDSQGAGVRVSTAILVVEQMYNEWWDNDRRRCLDAIVARLKSLPPEREANDAATQMRDACVERLGQVDRAHILSNNQDYERGFRDAIRSAQTALSSLTLNQVKQK